MTAGMLRFPDGFVWGAATSAYQIEGAWNRDGRGESIWDRFAHTPGRVAGGDTGDHACAHYDLFRDDVAHIARLGVQSYRLSIAWPRILPYGRGAPNQAGLDFYRRLLDALADHAIAPMITLYHWDLPQALQERGGWVNRDTAYRFADYAALVFREFGTRAPLWVTHNEPFNVALFGHVLGTHAPGQRRLWTLLPVMHHLLLSHGLAVQAFRALVNSAGNDTGGPRIGIAPAIWPNYPASPRPADVAANQRVDLVSNRLCLELLFRRQYPPELLRFFSQRLLRPPLRSGDLEIIGQPIDFLGINAYSRLVNRAVWYDPLFGARPLPPRGPTTALGWEIYPQCVADAIDIAAGYTDLPLYITENGAAFDDQPGPDGTLDDQDRIAFLQSHLVHVHRAIQAGRDVRGYYAWSLLDNFEWEWGYSKRFGLIHVDFATQQRTWKQSAHWYRQIVATNAIMAGSMARHG